MTFRVHNKFQHDGREWAVGEYNNRKDGRNEFGNAIHALDQSQSYGLVPTVEKGEVTDVKLTSSPEVPGLTLESLAPELRNRFSAALAWSAKQAGVKVEPELLEAVKEGRNLKAERDSEAEFQRETRRADFDLEAAYLTRDALKAETLTALDEGRDADAKAAMERLGAVKQDIKGYWNPNKPRPLVEQPLSENEKLEVQLNEMTTAEELQQEAAGLAIAEFGKQAAEALSRGDVDAHDAAIEKVRHYTDLHKTAKKTEEPAEEKGGSHADRLRQQRSANQGEGKSR